MNEVEKITVTAGISYVAGLLTRWPLDKLLERRAFVRSVADRYIAIAQSNPESIKEDFYCIGTLQCIGAAELRPLEFRRICRRIKARGIADPRNRRFDIFSDQRQRLRPLLRWATQKSINLADEERVLRLAFDEAEARKHR